VIEDVEVVEVAAVRQRRSLDHLDHLDDLDYLDWGSPPLRHREPQSDRRDRIDVRRSVRSGKLEEHGRRPIPTRRLGAAIDQTIARE
jgi:hypothetical protein